MTMAYRATVHESTKFSPNRLMLGREKNLPLDLMVGPSSNSKKNACYGEYIEWLKRRMEKFLRGSTKFHETSSVTSKEKL